MGISREADSPHGLHESILETIATTTSIAVLGPNNCLGTILCERRMPANRKRSVTGLSRWSVMTQLWTCHWGTWNLLRCNWEEVLGIYPSPLTPPDVSGPRLEISSALPVHDNSFLIFSLIIFSLAGCEVFFFFYSFTFPLFYSFTGLFWVKFMRCFPSI